MLSNISGVRWLKPLLVVLISYGIYKYRNSLIEAVIYATSLRLVLLYGLIFALISLMASGLRAKHIINKVGGFMSNVEAFEFSTVSASAVFSLVRVGTGIPLYYLKKTGVLLSHTVTYYVVDRFFSTMSILVLGALVLGDFRWISTALLVIAAIGTVIGLKYTHKLPDFWPFGMIKDFSGDIKKLVNIRSALWLSFLAFMNFAADSLAITSLSGAGISVSLTAAVLGMAAMLVSPTPAGIGIYEPIVAGHLISLGIATNAAVGAVLVYRLFVLWLPALLGVQTLHRKL